MFWLILLAVALLVLWIVGSFVFDLGVLSIVAVVKAVSWNRRRIENAVDYRGADESFRRRTDRGGDERVRALSARLREERGEAPSEDDEREASFRRLRGEERR